MSLSVDYSGDYQFIDGIETVSLTPQNPAAAAITGVSATRTTLSKDPTVPGDAYSGESESIVFFLWTATTSSTTPKPGDYITDASSVVHVITSVSTRSDGAQYRCLTNKLP